MGRPVQVRIEAVSGLKVWGSGSAGSKSKLENSRFRVHADFLAAERV